MPRTIRLSVAPQAFSASATASRQTRSSTRLVARLLDLTIER
jgi:hypothetical protein